MIGMILYLAGSSISNITYAVYKYTRFSDNPIHSAGLLDMITISTLLRPSCPIDTVKPVLLTTLNKDTRKHAM